ncbi:hypothetical protein BGX38DRAFT_1249082 [Terfezia claveryi]|nr:hypothetical protein BGX38DRAFT_1249082 [Terfezia claveryi]
MALIPPPSVEDLLPPFLAHIPIAFSSPQPPPSLLPLLAPILRSRVRLLSSFIPDNPATTTTSPRSPTDSWLSLLTWSSTGAEFCQHLSQQDFSPHPSGEFEIGEYEFKGVRRVDEETVKARVELLERGIEIVYVWVDEKEDKDEGAGWKIVDVRLVKGQEPERGEWYPTVTSAEGGFREEREKRRIESEPMKESQLVTPSSKPIANSYLSPSFSFPPPGDDEEDNSYWDMYDRSPARTPAVQHQTQIQSEDDYFARYANIQPALDSGEEVKEPPQSQENSYTAPPPIYSNYNSSTTNAFPQPQPTQTLPQPQSQSSTFLPPIPLSPPTSSPSKSASIHSHTPPFASVEIKIPSPRSGSPSASISALEDLANQQLQAETGVKQHISTSIKSLFRLAKVVGMGREEFERVVRTELGVLGMVEEVEEGGSL